MKKVIKEEAEEEAERDGAYESHEGLPVVEQGVQYRYKWRCGTGNIIIRECTLAQ